MALWTASWGNWFLQLSIESICLQLFQDANNLNLLTYQVKQKLLTGSGDRLFNGDERMRIHIDLVVRQSHPDVHRFFWRLFVAACASISDTRFLRRNVWVRVHLLIWWGLELLDNILLLFAYAIDVGTGITMTVVKLRLLSRVICDCLRFFGHFLFLILVTCLVRLKVVFEVILWIFFAWTSLFLFFLLFRLEIDCPRERYCWILAGFTLLGGWSLSNRRSFLRQDSMLSLSSFAVLKLFNFTLFVELSDVF